MLSAPLVPGWLLKDGFLLAWLCCAVSHASIAVVPYRDSRDAQVGCQHVVQVGKCAPSHEVSSSTGGCDQQALVLELHDRLLLIGGSFYPET